MNTKSLFAVMAILLSAFALISFTHFGVDVWQHFQSSQSAQHQASIDYSAAYSALGLIVIAAIFLILHAQRKH